MFRSSATPTDVMKASIFIASPLVYYMDQYITRRDAARLRDDHAAA